MVNSTAYYLHQDALGSTRLETTSTVTVTFSSNYVPYGNNYAMSGKEVFMYTGKPLDSATGLYYYGARYYDDSIGRFITQDSWNGTKYDPLSLNKYIYARDNPERYVDPNGHFFASMLIDGEYNMAYLRAMTSAPSSSSETSSVENTERSRDEYTATDSAWTTVSGGYVNTERARNEYIASPMDARYSTPIGGMANTELARNEYVQPTIGQTSGSGNSCVDVAAAGTLMAGMMGTIVAADLAPEVGGTLALAGLATFGIALPFIGAAIVYYYYTYHPDAKC